MIVIDHTATNLEELKQKIDFTLHYPQKIPMEERFVNAGEFRVQLKLCYNAGLLAARYVHHSYQGL